MLDPNFKKIARKINGVFRTPLLHAFRDKHDLIEKLTDHYMIIHVKKGRVENEQINNNFFIYITHYTDKESGNEYYVVINPYFLDVKNDIMGNKYNSKLIRVFRDSYNFEFIPITAERHVFVSKNEYDDDDMDDFDNDL